MSYKLFIGFLYTLSILNAEINANLLRSLPSFSVRTVKEHPYTIFALTTAATLGTTWYYAHDYERRKNWKNKKLIISKFPQGFKWGAATSELQLCGDETINGKTIENNWTDWQKKYDETQWMGNATGHWNKYPEDYRLAKEFGLDNLRISIEWSKIQPDNAETFNEEVIEHFLDRIREAKKQDLKLAIAFYHHALPNWFVAKGGFEKSENNNDFVKYALHLFKKIKNADLLDTISFWLTFNEPAGYVLAAYVHGKYPPGHKFNGTNFNDTLRLSGIVLKNMLDTHSAIYKGIKQLDPSQQISIAHMMQPIQPYNPWNPLDQLPAKIFNHLLNNVTLEYFSTGRFKWLWCINEVNEEAKNALDFLGVNYYTHTLLSMFKPKTRPFEITADSDEGDLGKAVYAEGFYNALITVHRYLPHIPLYITELGCATEDRELRKEYFKRHLIVLQKAMTKNNIKILGCDVWTLCDCFGWNSGNNSKYGLYHVDFSKEDKPRTLKPSSLYYKDIIAEYHRTHTSDVFAQKEMPDIV